MNSRAQVIVGVLAALMFGVAVVAAGAMESGGTTTAAARTANFAEAISKTLGTKTARFTFASETGVVDFQHNRIRYDGPPRAGRWSPLSVAALRAATRIKSVGSPRINHVDLTEYSAIVDGTLVHVWVDSHHHIRQFDTPAGLVTLSAFGTPAPV